MSVVQLGLEARAFAGGIGPVGGGPGAVGCRASAVRLGAGSNSLHLFRKQRVGGAIA